MASRAACSSAEPSEIAAVLGGTLKGIEEAISISPVWIRAITTVCQLRSRVRLYRTFTVKKQNDGQCHVRRKRSCWIVEAGSASAWFRFFGCEFLGVLFLPMGQ